MEHFLKFLVVGTWGFIVNTVILVLGVRVGMKPSISGPLGSEVAIISNFLLNNFWAFSDRRITNSADIPGKFIQFNILSFGSVIIQFVFLKTGEKIFGIVQFKKPIWTMPFFSWVAKWAIAKFVFSLPFVGKIAKNFSAYLVFYCCGVGVGLVVNFLVYSQIIWR